MLPIGPLMVEHRLIEKMLGAIGQAADFARAGGAIDPSDVDAMVDFMRTYADRIHHGKEEDILFRSLRGKELRAEDGRIMRELEDEHRKGRGIVRALSEANLSYRKGSEEKLESVLDGFANILALYPGHIVKEDRVFFPAAMEYFGRAEKHAMLDEMREFDRKLAQELYTAVVTELLERLAEARV